MRDLNRLREGQYIVEIEKLSTSVVPGPALLTGTRGARKVLVAELLVVESSVIESSVIDDAEEPTSVGDRVMHFFTGGPGAESFMRSVLSKLSGYPSIDKLLDWLTEDNQPAHGLRLQTKSRSAVSRATGRRFVLFDWSAAGKGSEEPAKIAEPTPKVDPYVAHRLREAELLARRP